MKPKIIKEETHYFECDRCEINSLSQDRMCPCPRGSCEAELRGVIEKVITVKLL